MWVRHLRLTDFRSYTDVSLDLAPGRVALVGSNGQGKTNIVEAIAYLATIGSHRAASDVPLVRKGADRAVIAAEVVKDDRSITIELEINPGKANRARINRGSPTRAREILGLVQCVVFAPEDLALVKGDPSERRNFLDDLLIQRSPRMQGVKSDYERIIKQRNALLKTSASARRTAREAMLATMAVWDEQLAAVGGELTAERITAMSDLLPHARKHYQRIAGGSEAVSDSEMELRYVPSYETEMTQTDVSIDKDVWAGELERAISARRDDEFDRGVTLVGPHRDDLAITLGEFPAKGYASHGESWSLALALRLASLDVLKTDGDEPILILDDVFAELDTTRRTALVEAIPDDAQVIITAAVEEDVPPQMAGQRWSIRRGSAQEDVPRVQR